MKKKTYPPECEQLLSFRIVNAIVASPLLEDEKKLLALEDLRQMYAEGYMPKKDLCPFDRQTNEWADSISAHHYFGASKLGMDFWYTMDEIIGKV